MTHEDAMVELAGAGFDRIVPDGRAVIVVSGEGRDSRARRYESAEAAAMTLVIEPRIEAQRKVETK